MLQALFILCRYRDVIFGYFIIGQFGERGIGARMGMPPEMGMPPMMGMPPGTGMPPGGVFPYGYGGPVMGPYSMYL